MGKRSKEVDEIARKLEAQGWRIETIGGGYRMAYPPRKDRRPVKLPSTPGGRRWRDNLIAVLRRSGAEI